MILLENSHFHCSLELDRGAFSLIVKQEAAPSLEGMHLGVILECSNRRISLLQAGWNVVSNREVEIHGANGQVKAVELEIVEKDFSFRLTFGLVEDSPLFIWKVLLRNSSSRPVFVNRLSLLRAGGRFAPTSHLGLPGGLMPAFFASGWQSWSHTAAWGAKEAPLRSRLGPLQNPMVINPQTPITHHQGHASADFYGVIGDRCSRRGLLAGFLSQRLQFGSLEAFLEEQPSLHMWAAGDGARVDPGGEMETDWAVIMPVNLDDPFPLDAYLDAAARENGARVPLESPSGWCSWYQYYQDLDSEDIRKNLHVLADQHSKYPLKLLQIDDGFETQVGDWFSFKPQFPQGVAPLAEEAQQAGLTPGLWLAPFIVHPASRLARQHSEWLLRRKDGRPVNAGFVWNALDTALDLTIPEALDYACRVVHTAVHEWGYPYLKLDFLYAGALPGRFRDATKTRAQVLRAGMEALRSAAGEEAFLLGCGLPLGSGVGVVDAMRIGADVSGSWRPSFAGIELPFRSEPHMPSARNSIQNILTRAHLHRKWWVNDPDCLLVRPDTRLTDAEVQSLAASIALTGGSLLLSDDLTCLPEDRLHLAASLLPVIGQRPRVLDWFDQSTPSLLRLDLKNPAGEWQILAVFNWTDQPQTVRLGAGDFDLPEVDFYVRSFWDARTCRIKRSQALWAGEMAPHGCVVLALRSQEEGRACYLGSDLHISQGIELAGWEEHVGGIALRIGLGRKAAGVVDLALPFPPRLALLDGKDIPVTLLGDDIYRFPVETSGDSYLEILQ